MKIYVSADIEGIAGISHWDEADPEKPDCAPFRERMSEHVAAACEGAVAAGAKDILVKDAHADARNVDAALLPTCARLIRGWSRHPLGMVQDLDESFDALVLVGYHSGAGSGGNPLAHTWSSSRVARVEINGLAVSEFHVNAMAAASMGVPTAFVSGDEALCREVRAFSPSTRCVPVLEGVGASTISIHPRVAAERIRAGVEEALRGDLAACRIELPARFEVSVRYRKAEQAWRMAWFPDVRMLDDETVAFERADLFEVLRALSFIL